MKTNTDTKKWIWTDEYLISSYDVDAGGKAPLTTLGRLMQETAYNHAEHLGFGYHQLKENNFFWVLSRLLIRVNRYPHWGERVVLRTWPTGIERLFAYRDYRLLDEQGVTLAEAGSAWLILDADKHRPQRPDELRARIDILPDKPALNERPAKIPALTHPVKGESFPVRYSDLDLYDHVNNAKYIEWILDSYPVTMLREKGLREFEINFLSETKMGERVAIHTQKTDDAHYLHCIRREGDDKEICMARTLWASENS